MKIAKHVGALGLAACCVVGLASVAVGQGRAQVPRVAVQAGTTADRVDHVRQELAAHPEWPQRAIVVDDDGRIALPFAPPDPPAYREWMKAVAEREEGAVAAIYTPTTSDPTEADLRDVSTWLMERLATLPEKDLPAFSIRPDVWRGATVFTYESTAGAEFLALAASAQSRFGPRIVTEISDLRGVGPQFLTAMGAAPR